MTLRIDKELFQWEKGRFVFVDIKEGEEPVTHVQFYNNKSKYGPEIPLVDGKALIPNYLLKENLPIMAVACTGIFGETQVVGRREFKVLKRAKPEYYVEDDDASKDIVYDGGIEV